VTCRATNDCGGSASCAFNIRVSQDQFQFREPFFFPLAPRDVALTNQCGSSCVPTPAYQLPTLYYGWLDRCTPPSGTCLPVGTHQVICRATNTCGQQTSTGFYVRVVEGRPPPPTIRIVKEEDLHFLFWENECGTIGLLEAADEPDGPWETLPGAGPGYMVNPSKFKRYFRVIVPE